MTEVGRIVATALVLAAMTAPAGSMTGLTRVSTGLASAPTAAAGAAAPAPPSLPSAGRIAEAAGRYGWPLWPPPAVSRPFRPPSLPYGPGHRGADLIGADGRAVLSAGAGVVVYAAPLAGRGVVSVDHPDGLRTTYEPVRSSVRPGQVVARGQQLGELTAGHPGCPVPACLHWGLRRERTYLDPLVLVRPARVRLLPYPPDEP